MNYTIFTRERVEPKTFTSGAINPGPPPIYPPGASLAYTPPELDIYSADPLQRQVLLSDPNGNATPAEVAAAFPAFRAAQMDVVRAKCREHILATYPVWYQSNVALGIYGQPIADKLRDDIAAVITESNRCEQLIYDGQPYTLNFPKIGYSI